MKTAYLVGAINHKADPPVYTGASIVSEACPTSHYYTWVIAETSGESYSEAVAAMERLLEHPAYRWARPRDMRDPSDCGPEALAAYFNAPVRFEALDWHWIKGRGLVITVVWPSDLSLSKLTERAKAGGAKVLINEIPVTVIGIETFKPNVHDDRAPGGKAGLLVKHDGTLCSICQKPQFQTDSGTVCPNGHGGAPSLEDQ